MVRRWVRAFGRIGPGCARPVSAAARLRLRTRLNLPEPTNKQGRPLFLGTALFVGAPGRITPHLRCSVIDAPAALRFRKSEPSLDPQTHKGAPSRGRPCVLARPEGFEPPTPRFVVWCSIQLSYGRAWRAPHKGGACAWQSPIRRGIRPSRKSRAPAPRRAAASAARRSRRGGTSRSLRLRALEVHPSNAAICKAG